MDHIDHIDHISLSQRSRVMNATMHCMFIFSMLTCYEESNGRARIAQPLRYVLWDTKTSMKTLAHSYVTMETASKVKAGFCQEIQLKPIPQVQHQAAAQAIQHQVVQPQPYPLPWPLTWLLAASP